MNGRPDHSATLVAYNYTHGVHNYQIDNIVEAMNMFIHSFFNNNFTLIYIVFPKNPCF